MVFSTTKNTKPRERKKWVGPNIIRAERSEREVAAIVLYSETGFQYFPGHGRTSRTVAHGTISCIWCDSQMLSAVRVPPLGLTDGAGITRYYTRETPNVKGGTHVSARLLRFICYSQ